MAKRTPITEATLIALSRFWRGLRTGPIVFYAACGAISAVVFPSAEWIGSIGTILSKPGSVYWLSALINCVAIALLFAFIRAGMSADALKSSAHHERDLSTEYHLLDDVPIGVGDPDELERGEIASAVAPLLVLPSLAKSIVVAIEAGWGEGKSSLLSLIKSKLNRHVDEPIVITFNPWFVHSREQVLRSFFAHIVSVLDRDESESIEAVRSLKSYARMLEVTMPSAVGALSNFLIDNHLDVGTLAEEKERVDRAFASVARPIVVIIDDIDRLPADDIRIIFQLVKIVADFQRVSYLLAFDPVPIDRALRFDGLYKQGREYREKVVQLGIAVPRAPYLARQKYFVSRLDQRIQSWGIQLDDDDRRAVNDALHLALRASTTPRELKRLLNAWCLASKMLSGEVNLGDVLTLEMIAQRFPRAFGLILQNPSRLVGSGMFSYGFEQDSMSQASASARNQSEEQKRNTLREELLKFGGNQIERKVLEDALIFLFPRALARNVLDVVQARSPHRRVDDRDTLDTYFARRVPGGALSRKTASTFFTDPASRPGILADAVATRSLGALLDFLVRNVRAPEDAPNTFEKTSDAVMQTWNVDRIDAVESATDLVLEILKLLTPDLAQASLRQFVESEASIAVAEQVLARISREPHEWQTSFPDGFIKLLRGGWLEKVKALGVQVILKEQPRPISIFFRWGQFEDPPYQSVKERLDEFLSDSVNATEFSKGFWPRNGIAMGLDGVDKLIKNPARLLGLLRKGGPMIQVLESFEEKFGDKPE
jgi:hypothetical protein